MDPVYICKRKRDSCMEVVFSEIEIVIVERFMSTFDSSFENRTDLRFIKLPCAAVSEEDLGMLDRMSRMPFIAAMDAAFTRVVDFESEEIALSHGVTKDTERFMGMLGIHVTLEDAEHQHHQRQGRSLCMEIFDPKWYKIIPADMHDYKKWKAFYVTAQVLESPNTGYAEPTASVSPGFKWRAQIVAHAYPNMYHLEYADTGDENSDYSYRNKLLKDCEPFSDAEGIY